jgi:hypothetical protein
MLIGVAAAWTAAIASAAEAEWPGHSASDLSAFVTLQRFRIYAEHCSASVPELKPQFDSRMQDLASRLQGISKEILASAVFSDMQNKPVPAEIVAAFKDSFDDMRHNVERRDAAVICPATLQDFGDMDNETLKSGLRETLTALQKMMRNLEKDNAR